MTIGIIEDDRLLSRSLKVVLEKEGYRTLQVYTKKDAGQILQGTEELLLVDIGLPDGNGMELYHTLMKKWNRKIPAIFLTARDEEQEMLKAFDLGAEDYVVKPFSMKDISYGKRVSAPGISDEKSGAGSDQRKYFGACMGN